MYTMNSCGCERYRCGECKIQALGRTQGLVQVQHGDERKVWDARHRLQHPEPAMNDIDEPPQRLKCKLFQMLVMADNWMTLCQGSVLAAQGAPLDRAVVEDHVQRPAQQAEGQADEPWGLHLAVRRLTRVLPHQHRLVAQLQLVELVAHLPRAGYEREVVMICGLSDHCIPMHPDASTVAL